MDSANRAQLSTYRGEEGKEERSEQKEKEPSAKLFKNDRSNFVVHT